MTDLFQDIGGLTDATTSRRDAIRTSAGIGLTAAFAAIPFLKPGHVMAQTTSGDFGILNYALTLEYLERSFYRQVNNTGLVPSADAPLFDTIRTDEDRHVEVLRGAITGAGGTPVEFDDDQFVFDAFLNSYDDILTLAQGLEDTGVRAYKGQAASIGSNSYLTVALQIHSVEARHAAAIRRLRGNSGWIRDGEPDANGTPIQAVYGPGSPAVDFPGEGNTTQGGINLAAVFGRFTNTQLSSAFDEPLDMDTVLSIADGFIRSDEL